MIGCQKVNTTKKPKTNQTTKGHITKEESREKGYKTELKYKMSFNL